jgi:hypothetical protein
LDERTASPFTEHRGTPLEIELPPKTIDEGEIASGGLQSSFQRGFSAAC